MMHEMMKKAMGKEDGPDMEKDAKLKVLKELRAMASGMMGDDIKGGMMKKVSVAAPDEEGLKAGLDKAKEIVGDKGPHDDMDEEEEMESPEEEAHEMASGEEKEEDMSPEELDAQIAKLQEMKKKAMVRSKY